MSPLIAGLLSSIALPTVIEGVLLPNLGWIAWVSLIPLYLTLRESRPVSALKAGFFFGLAYYGLSLCWIYTALHTYGEMAVWASLLAISAVVISLSFFSAAAAWLAVIAQRRGISLLIAFPLAWIVSEFLRAHFPLGGFPWSNLAYTQRGFLSLLQILDLTGVYGVLFFILFANALIGELWLWSRKKAAGPPRAGKAGRFGSNSGVNPDSPPNPHRGNISAKCGDVTGFECKVSLIAFLILFFASLLYGHFQLLALHKDSQSREKIRASLIQGNIPQDEKWQDEMVEEIITRHLTLSKEAEKEGPELLIWPEASYPAVLPPEIVRVDLLKGLKVPLLMGVVTYKGTIPEDWPPVLGDEGFTLFNGAALLNQGIVSGWYFKNHLVPMGEYVPFGHTLFFLRQVVNSLSSFTPGKELNLIHSSTRQFGVTICYEDLFPEISRALTQKGAGFLVNLTNDAWYENSSALYQHFDFSRFRAIENRRTMVRATNTGVTGIFAPTGEVIASAPPLQEAVLTADFPVGGPLSLYTRFGDWFAWGCVFGLSLLFLVNKISRRTHDQ